MSRGVKWMKDSSTGGVCLLIGIAHSDLQSRGDLPAQGIHAGDVYKL